MLKHFVITLRWRNFLNDRTYEIGNNNYDCIIIMPMCLLYTSSLDTYIFIYGSMERICILICLIVETKFQYYFITRIQQLVILYNIVIAQVRNIVRLYTIYCF